MKNLKTHIKNNILHPFLNIIFNNYKVKYPIDINSIKRILIVRNDRIGDMIVTTPIFKILKDNNPNIKIDVLASKVNSEIIKNNIHVDNVYEYPNNVTEKIKLINMLKQNNYDVSVNLVFNKMTNQGILINLLAKNAIKIGQGASNYSYLYNIYFSFSRDVKPMAELILDIFSNSFLFQKGISEVSYNIFIDKDSNDRIEKFLINHHMKKNNYCVFNLSASDNYTKLSIDQIKEVSEYLYNLNTFKIIYIYAPNDLAMEKCANEMMKLKYGIIYPEKGLANLLSIAALMQSAKFVITPDTSIVHFASATKTPVLAIYSSYKEKKEWLPYNVSSKIVISPNKLPVSYISNNSIIRILNDLLNLIKT